MKSRFYSRNEVKCMYDVEMMQMLNLIHAENQYIFEILKSSLLSKEVRDDITFDDYDKEYKRIIKSLEKYSSCLDCNYKNRFEKIKNIKKERNKEQSKEKQNPLKDIKPKEIPTVKRTFEYHGKKEEKENK